MWAVVTYLCSLWGIATRPSSRQTFSDLVCFWAELSLEACRESWPERISGWGLCCSGCVLHALGSVQARHERKVCTAKGNFASCVTVDLFAARAKHFSQAVITICSFILFQPTSELHSVMYYWCKMHVGHATLQYLTVQIKLYALYAYKKSANIISRYQLKWEKSTTACIKLTKYEVVWERCKTLVPNPSP